MNSTNIDTVIDNYTKEVMRKFLHISSLWIPFAIWTLNFSTAFIIIGIAFLLISIFELLRRKNSHVATWANRYFALLMRVSEMQQKPKITGAFFMLLGALITMLIADKEIAVIALTVLMISDSLAALIGKKWGKHNIGNKTVEGSLSFLASALLVCYLAILMIPEISSVSIVACIIACFSSTIAEFYAKNIHIDDNLLIPITFVSTHFLISLILSTSSII
jgi:dolichol kinase